MGMIHKKSRTTGKRPRRTGEKVAQNTGIDFLALRSGVVLSLPILVQKGSFPAISHCVFNECRPSTVFYSIAIVVV